MKKGRPALSTRACLRVICTPDGSGVPNGAQTKVLLVRFMEDGSEDIIPLTGELNIVGVKWEVESRQHQSLLTLKVRGAQIAVEESIDRDAEQQIEAALVVQDRKLRKRPV